MAVRHQALRLAARALEQKLNADTSDYVGPELPCPCGGSAQYRGRHEKTSESVLGPLRLKRAYYHCEPCRSGFCPRDRSLGLESFSLTPGVLRTAVQISRNGACGIAKSGVFSCRGHRLRVGVGIGAIQVA